MYKYKHQPSSINMHVYEGEPFRTQYSEDIFRSSPEAVYYASKIINDANTSISEGKITDVDYIDKAATWVVLQINYNRDDYLLGLNDAIYEGSGVCWHYAELFKALLDSVGIKNELVYGTVNDTRHCWNKVTLNDTDYYFDLSWQSFCGSSDRYMWLTKEEMSALHGNEVLEETG